MQNLFFLSIILVRKKNVQNKNTKTIQKQKQKSNITFCCGDCRTSTEVSPVGSWAPSKATPGRTTEEKEKRMAGAQTAAYCQKGREFRCFLQSRTQKNKNKNNTCGLLKPHKLYQHNVLRSLKGFSDIFYFIVYFKVVFKTKHTETKPRNGLAVCSQKYKHHAVCASRAALKTITKNWNHKIKWLSYEVLEK